MGNVVHDTVKDTGGMPFGGYRVLQLAGMTKIAK